MIKLRIATGLGLLLLTATMACGPVGMSQRQATEYVYRTFAREMGIHLSPAPDNQPQQPKPLTRLIVQPLDC